MYIVHDITSILLTFAEKEIYMNYINIRAERLNRLVEDDEQSKMGIGAKNVEQYVLLWCTRMYVHAIRYKYILNRRVDISNAGMSLYGGIIMGNFPKAPLKQCQKELVRCECGD